MSIATTTTTTTEPQMNTEPLPACCTPSKDASLAEILYCEYQRGGPPERAGLAWDGQPCPTWAQLVSRAEGGNAGARGVVAKWEAVAGSMRALGTRA